MRCPSLIRGTKKATSTSAPPSSSLPTSPYHPISIHHITRGAQASAQLRLMSAARLTHVAKELSGYGACPNVPISVLPPPLTSSLSTCSSVGCPYRALGWLDGLACTLAHVQSRDAGPQSSAALVRQFEAGIDALVCQVQVRQDRDRGSPDAGGGRVIRGSRGTNCSRYGAAKELIKNNTHIRDILYQSCDTTAIVTGSGWLVVLLGYIRRLGRRTDRLLGSLQAYATATYS